MPPVITYMAIYASAYLGGTIAAWSWVATLLVNSVVMFGAQKLLGKKPSLPDFMSDASERTQMVRSSISPRRTVYGRAKVSGTLVYAKETGSKREYLHMVIVLCSHESEAVLDIFVNDELVDMNGSVPAVGSKYAGHLRVNAHLGTAAQTADSDLVSECGPEWTTDHRLRGHTYLAVRVKYNVDVFPAGLPTIAAVVKGAKLEDPRTSTTAWSNNAAMCIRHFMMSQYGVGALSAEFDSSVLNASCNTCDDDVGLATSFTRQCDIESGNRHIGMTTQAVSELDDVQPGMLVSGTGIPAGAIIVSINAKLDAYNQVFFTIDRDPTATNNNETVTFGDTEKRYTLNGTVDSNIKAGDVLDAMLSAMAGKLVYAGGKWYLHAGAYQTPTVSLSEDDCRGPIQVSTKLARRELANRVKGVFVSEAEGWVSTDFPPYAPALYLTEDDNEELNRDVQLPFTTSVSTAQRLAKIELERLRQQITTRWACKFSALKIQCGDTVMLNNTREGWTNKPFEVTSLVLVPYKDAKGNPAIGVDLVMRETASGVWDWTDGTETVVDLAPNTTLHDPFQVFPPSVLVLLSDSTTAWLNADGVHSPRLKVSWTAPDDQYVISGGRIQVQYKKSADATWLDWAEVMGDQTEEFITDVRSGDTMDVRIRSKSVRGNVSEWVTSSGYVIPGDIIAPDPVSGLTATALPEAIRLNWTLPSLIVEPNTDLDRVEVYELGAATPAPVAGTTPTWRLGKVTTFTRDGMSAGSTGYYWVRTLDRTGNKSAWVGPVNATAANGVTHALASANAKNKNFYQTTAPTNPIGGYYLTAGDNWYDTDDSNKLYEWSGAAWVAAFQPLIKLDGSNNITGLVKSDGTSKDWVMVADKFQIWDGTSADVPFEIVGGVVKIKDAKIQHVDAAKITTGTLGAETITMSNSASSKIVSGNYVAGTSGFQILGNGTVEFRGGTIGGYDINAASLGSTSNKFLLQATRMTLGVASSYGIDFNWPSATDGTMDGWHNSEKAFSLSHSGSTGLGRLTLYGATDSDSENQIWADTNAANYFQVRRTSSFNANFIGGPHAGSVQASYLFTILHRHNDTGKYGLFVGTNWAAVENKVFTAASVDATTGAVNELFNVLGDGTLQFGVHAGIGAETVTGYITIKDDAGNDRKLAVVS